MNDQTRDRHTRQSNHTTDRIDRQTDRQTQRHSRNRRQRGAWAWTVPDRCTDVWHGHGRMDDLTDRVDRQTDRRNITHVTQQKTAETHGHGQNPTDARTHDMDMDGWTIRDIQRDNRQTIHTDD